MSKNKKKSAGRPDRTCPMTGKPCDGECSRDEKANCCG